MQQGKGDTILALFCLQPKRCSKCLHRFFRFNRHAKYVLPLMVCLLIAGVELRRQIRQYRIDGARQRAVQMMAMPGDGSSNSVPDSPATVPAKPDPSSAR